MAKKNRLTKILASPHVYEITFRMTISEPAFAVTIRCLDGDRLSFTPSVVETSTIIGWMHANWITMTYTSMRDDVVHIDYSDGRYD